MYPFKFGSPLKHICGRRESAENNFCFSQQWAQVAAGFVLNLNFFFNTFNLHPFVTLAPLFGNKLVYPSTRETRGETVAISSTAPGTGPSLIL